MSKLERIVVLDDGESWGGPNIVVEYIQDKVSEHAIRTMNDCSEVNDLVDNIQDHNAKGEKVGRLLNINRLVELYDALKNAPNDLVLTPEIWEVLKQVDVT